MSTGINAINAAVKEASSFTTPLFAELGKVIVGQNYLTERLVIGLLANGHVLLEGVPGLAKTLMISSLSQLLSITFSRIQFTPDLMPSDITGTEILQEDKQSGQRKEETEWHDVEVWGKQAEQCGEYLAKGRQVYVEVLAPPPGILVCGAGPDAVPLVHLLTGLGFAVTVADHRPLYLESPDWRGARTSLGPAATLATRLRLNAFHAAVVMSHHLASDEAYLSALATSSVASVGLLGPRARRERLLAALGPTAAMLRPRLRGPVGLDIGAVTPEAIALAVAAEIHALAAGRLATIAGTCDDLP